MFFWLEIIKNSFHICSVIAFFLISLPTAFVDLSFSFKNQMKTQIYFSQARLGWILNVCPF